MIMIIMTLLQQLSEIGANHLLDLCFLLNLFSGGKSNAFPTSYFLFASSSQDRIMFF